MKHLLLPLTGGVIIGAIIVLPIYYNMDGISHFFSEHYQATYWLLTVLTIAYCWWRLDVTYPEWRMMERFEFWVKRLFKRK